jgi:hypothetical protein
MLRSIDAPSNIQVVFTFTWRINPSQAWNLIIYISNDEIHMDMTSAVLVDE